jgi:AcrR family transcriptional regulator
MTRIANSETRPYRSELRAQQAEETRARILDAAIRVMARGVPFVSIPAVAREAGVSVATVYRHFATKRDLLAAVYPHTMQRAGLRDFVIPSSLEDLRERMREIFAQVDSFDDLARAAMASPAAAEVRQLSMPRRLALIRRLAANIEPTLAADDLDRIARLVMILTSSAALRAWRDHFGLSVDEAADDVAWMIRAAIAAATRRKER